jgi:hypothetical protein
LEKENEKEKAKLTELEKFEKKAKEIKTSTTPSRMGDFAKPTINSRHKQVSKKNLFSSIDGHTRSGRGEGATSQYYASPKRMHVSTMKQDFQKTSQTHLNLHTPLGIKRNQTVQTAMSRQSMPQLPSTQQAAEAGMASPPTSPSRVSSTVKLD